MPDILHPVLGSLSAHPYLYLFVGLLFAGELVLLPAIYLAVNGRLHIAQVVGVAFCATMLADLGLYCLGRRFPAAALRKLAGPGANRLVIGIERLFHARGVQVVFFSKFVYGTRATVQVLAGLQGLPLRAYLVANALGVATLTLALSGIAWSVAGTARRYSETVHGMELAFGAFVLIAAGAYVGIAMLVRRRWSQ